MSREDFDNESLEDQKQRMSKIGKLMDSGRDEKMEDSDPIEFNGSWSKESKDSYAEKIVKDLTGKFNKWAAWRQPYDDLFEEIYGLYHSTTSARKTKTRTKIFIPIVFQVIEAAIPKIINTLFSVDEFFEVHPLDSVDEDLGDDIRKLIVAQLRMANFYVKFLDFAKQLLLYGTSYLKVYWKVRRAWVWTRVPVREQVVIDGFEVSNDIVDWEETKEYKIVERRPEVEVVDILDVFPNPEAETETDEGRGFFIRTWMSLEDFKKMGAGEFPVFANTDSSRLSDNSHSRSESRQERRSTRGMTQDYSESKQVELISYWGPYDVDGDGIEEEAHIVIANKSVLAKAQGNPFHHQRRPLLRTVLFNSPKEWFGIGMVEPVIPLQHELNTLRRQRLDNINLMINRMWLIDGGADIDLDSLTSTPNGIITRDSNKDSVEPLEQKDVTQSAYIEAQNVQTDIENTTTPRSAQGTPQSGRLGRTASGAKLIIGQALDKFSLIAKVIELMCLQPLVEIIHDLNGQFIDDDETLQDPKLYGAILQNPRTPEEIRTQSRFIVRAGSQMIANEAKVQNAMQFIQMFQNSLTPESMTILMQKVWSWMDGDPSVTNALQAQPTPQQQNVAIGQQDADTATMQTMLQAQQQPPQ